MTPYCFCKSGCGCGVLDSIIANSKKKKKRVISPLRMDPQRLTGLRRQFLTDVNTRFAELRRDINELINKQDAFGLKPEGGLAFNADRRYRFLSSDQKVNEFGKWLQGKIDAGILETVEGSKPWTSKYIDSAYKRGLVNAWTEANRAKLFPQTSPDYYRGSRDEFVNTSFALPETQERVKLMYTRSFEGMRGLSSNMRSHMSRVAAQGLADGIGALEMARNLIDGTNMAISRARTIARTELAFAYSEAQLDGFEALGVDEVGVMAEWSTVGDNLVCPLCSPLEGTIMTIKEARGLIPRHPNCRCGWLPANVGEKEKGQKRTKAAIKQALDKSVRRESPKAKTLKDARERSRWVGADVRAKGKPKQPPLRSR